MEQQVSVENYVGQELVLFSEAHNWKQRVGSEIERFVKGDVLEVGAGIGSNTHLFLNRFREHVKSWTCLEPDVQMSANIRSKMGEAANVQTGTLATLGPTLGEFDSILYMDVLEHIEDDTQEVNRALSLLKPGGFLVVLSPSHNFLFSPFDKAIGHFRRYDKKMLSAIQTPSAAMVRLRYLDSCGMILSLANRMMLRQTYPNARQIWIWDTFVVPLSRVVDKVLAHQVGKSILSVWQKK